MICLCQLQFTRHCLCMPKDEPANIYFIYQSKIRKYNHYRNSGLTYLEQISKYLRTDKTVRFLTGEMPTMPRTRNCETWVLSHTTFLSDDGDEMFASNLSVHFQIFSHHSQPIAVLSTTYKFTHELSFCSHLQPSR